MCFASPKAFTQQYTPSCKRRVKREIDLFYIFTFSLSFIYAFFIIFWPENTDNYIKSHL